MRLSAEKMHETVDDKQPPATAVDPAALGELAALLRASLRAHRQAGVASYPLTPGLRRFVVAATALVGQSEGMRPAPRPAVDQRAEEKPQLETPYPAESARLDTLWEEVATCRLCSRAETRQVQGRGGTSSGLMFVGDYANQNEDAATEVLFGLQEDVMLWNMVARVVGLPPEAVYVTNVVKCCPLPGQAPVPGSCEQCARHLQRELALVQPRIICAMGDVAAAALLGGNESVFRRRGRLHKYKQGGELLAGTQVVVTFHPRLLLAQPDLKQAAWQDLQMLQRCLRQPPRAKG